MRSRSVPAVSAVNVTVLVEVSNKLCVSIVLTVKGKVVFKKSKSDRTYVSVKPN